MAGSKKTHPTHCPIAFGLSTFGDRWSLLIVRDLMMKGSDAYGQFLQSGEGIATNVLADRLKNLEAAGIVKKAQVPENRRKYRYWLTDKGWDLAPIILSMILWSARHDPKTIVPKEVVARIKRDPEGFIAEKRARQK